MPNTTTFIAPGAVPGAVPGGGWMPVVSLWNESSDPFVSNAKRAAVISVGPPSLCAAGYACGAGSPAKTGIGTPHLLKGYGAQRRTEVTRWMPFSTLVGYSPVLAMRVSFLSGSGTYPSCVSFKKVAKTSNNMATQAQARLHQKSTWRVLVACRPRVMCMGNVCRRCCRG